MVFSYYMMMTMLYAKILLITKKNTHEMNQTLKRGFRDAKKYVQSTEYKKIPSVYVGR